MGDPGIKASRVMNVDGIPGQFGGLYRVTSATHTIDGSGYRTQFEARKEVWFGSIPLPKGPSGLLRVQGQTIRNREVIEWHPHCMNSAAEGQDQANEASEDQHYPRESYKATAMDLVQGKVLVRLPSLNQEVWARLTAPGAGRGTGLFHAPNANDEVLVALIHADPVRCIHHRRNVEHNRHTANPSRIAHKCADKANHSDWGLG